MPGTEGTSMENNAQLKALYALMQELKERAPRGVNVVVAIHTDGKMFIIFNFPEVEPCPQPFQLTIDGLKDITDNKATDILHITFNRLRQYIENGYSGKVEEIGDIGDNG